MDIFEQASRRKLRFETALGQLNTEDLWSLPLSAREIVTRPGGSRVNLNAIAIALHERIQASAVSFVEAAPKVATDLQLSFDVVKHVIDVRIAERDAMKEAITKIERKQKLLSVLARKQDAALEEMSEAEIKELIDAT